MKAKALLLAAALSSTLAPSALAQFGILTGF